MNGFFKDEKTIKRMQEGPLGEHINLYASRLHADGYTRWSGRRMLDMVTDFNRWLLTKRIQPFQIKSDHVERYLHQIEQTHTWPFTSGRVALKRWLVVLCDREVISPSTPEKIAPKERMISDYGQYLTRQRGLSSRTRDAYLPLASKFLNDRFGRGRIDLSKLRPSDLIDCIRDYARGRSGRRALLMATALRSFLQYAHQKGAIVSDLAVHVPPVAIAPATSIQRSLETAHIEKAIAQSAQNTPVGRRNHAILLLLARLGLRASEIVELMLDDIDWEENSIRVRGKGNRLDRLPMPKDVGGAIAAYLMNGRPRVASSRQVFLLARAPLSGFKTASSVSLIAKQALTMASVASPRKGAHQFRHTLACELLRRGCSLGEIGEILRHRSPDTTAIYAKVDFHTLRPLAFPWPGGVI